MQFPTDGYKFLTQEIMGAQKFNFEPKLPQNGNFQPQVSYFLKKISFSDRVEFRA